MGGAIYNERILNVKSCEFKNNIASDGNHIESENTGNLIYLIVILIKAITLYNLYGKSVKHFNNQL